MATAAPSARPRAVRMAGRMRPDAEVPIERPRIRALMALPSLVNPSVAKLTIVVDIFEMNRHQRAGFVFVGIDPADEAAFAAWRAAHPEV